MTDERPRILFLAHLFPWPLEGGGQIKSYHTLRLLASRYDITLIAFIRTENKTAIDAVRPLCTGGIEVVRLPAGTLRNLTALPHALRASAPFLLQRDDVPQMHAAVRRTLAAATFDAIHVDHLPMVTFVPSCDGEGPAVVLDQHNVEHRILERLAASADTRPHVRSVAQAEAARMRRAERLACRRADRILAVSEDDAGALRTLAGPEAADRVRVTPIGVDTAFFQPCTNRPDRSPNDCRTMLTVGTMYWPPNVDGVRWFHREVLPRIRERLAAGGAPDRPLRFVIAGTRPNRVIRALAGPSVEVTGTVPDVRPLMGTADAFVAPLRFGSGVRVKILNALAMGLPIVSTSIGAEGLDVTHGENILLADSAEDFAEAVANVLTEPELARRLGTAARDLAVRRYNWETAGWTLLHTYEELLGPSATVSVAS